MDEKRPSCSPLDKKKKAVLEGEALGQLGSLKGVLVDGQVTFLYQNIGLKGEL